MFNLIIDNRRHKIGPCENFGRRTIPNLFIECTLFIRHVYYISFMIYNLQLIYKFVELPKPDSSRAIICLLVKFDKRLLIS